MNIWYLILKLETTAKRWFSFLTGKVSFIEQEQKFVEAITDIHWKKQSLYITSGKQYVINYAQDKFLWFQWDWQYSSDRLAKRKKGDCNSIHRVFQMYYAMKGYDSYLVTTYAIPLKKSHSFCVYLKDYKYVLVDYDKSIAFPSLSAVINAVSVAYDCQIRAVVVQDVKWKYVKV